MSFLVLAAAGTGSRFGSGIPKQFLPLDGRPVYLHGLATLREHCRGGVVVVPRGWVREVRREVAKLGWPGGLEVVAGGAERQDSVWRGLERLAGEDEIVLVHDAARPFLCAALAERVLEGARRHGACLPALPVADTVKEVEGSKVVRTLDRTRLRLVQTPQGFRLGLLKAAFEQAIRDDFTGTDEASLVERTGHPVHVVDGDPANVKITWPGDLN